MPSKKQYDLVPNDEYDTRIPLHPEEAFHHGITFQAKFIGMLDVPRPTSRVEIVSAMRRIRYEFKAKGIKKKKVTIEVSIDGVKVTLRKKKKRRHWDDKNMLFQHPIYRIFYVSHDSQDVKVFSYIARDGASNVFKCAVFKTSKKSQAMRVVRTIGQAFEVCHKLSITAPENEQDTLDPDEQDTMTQDLLSDRFSDIACSDKPKKDIISEGASDKASLPADDCISIKDMYPYENGPKHRSVQLDILAPPPSSKKNQFSAETYAAPHSDILGSNGNYQQHTTANSLGSGGSSGALSAQHELQLIREQLDQQHQQTQAAMAQLQLAREQLASEKAARLEAQARTHQLLIHNRELLDHIAALVAHLQGSDKPGQQPPPPHMAMPQLNHHIPSDFNPDRQELPPQLDTNLLLQALGLNSQGLIENRAIGANLPASPLRNSFPGTGGIFNFNPYSPPPNENFDSYQLGQVLQRIQSLQNGGYTNSQPFSLGQSMPYLGQSLYNHQHPLLNNYYGLQSPPSNYQNNLYATLPRNLSNLEKRVQNSRHSEPRTLPSDGYSTTNSNLAYQTPPINLERYQKPTFPTSTQTDQSKNQQFQKNPNLTLPEMRRINLQQGGGTNLQRSNSTLQLSHDRRFQRGASPMPETMTNSKDNNNQSTRPVGQIRTLSTSDSEGKVRVNLPVPSNSIDEADDTLSNLRISDELKLMNGPGISRSCSERVPNRSEMMSQVQRTWSRHTTK